MKTLETAARSSARPGVSILRAALTSDSLVWILLGVFLLSMGAVSRSFFSLENLGNLALNSTVLGVLVIAESLCLILGKFDLSIESTLVFSAMVGALLVKSGVDPYLSMGAALAVGAGIGLVNGLLIAYVGVNPFMQTLAVNIILRGLVFVVTKGITIYRFPDAYRVFGATAPFGIPAPVIAFAVLYLLFSVLLERRKWGRRLYLTGANERAALYSGIAVKRVTVQAFVLAGLLAAVAGILASTRINVVHNNLAKGQVFEVFAAAVIGGVSLTGGKGRLIGALGGVLFLGCIVSMLTWLRVDAFIVQTVRGGIILLAMLLDAFKLKAREQLLA